VHQPEQAPLGKPEHLMVKAAEHAMINRRATLFKALQLTRVGGEVFPLDQFSIFKTHTIV
jgi:hypothetical protein